jgi:hypothetical protein
MTIASEESVVTTMPLLREVQSTLRSSPVFAFFLLLALAGGGYLGLVTFLMNVYPDVLPAALAQMSHFGTETHRVHDVAYGSIFAVGVVGLFVQLRRPTNNIAAMVMAVVPWAALLLAAVLSDSYTAVVGRNPWYPIAVTVVFAALLHPAGRDFFRSFRFSRANWVLLALVGVAVVPLVSFASTNLQLQQGTADAHTPMGHYGFMAASSYSILALGLLASLRPAGWRLTAWAAGLLPAVLGISSWLYPDVVSGLDLLWALAAVVWGAAFIAAAELSKDAGRPGDVDRPASLRA